MQTVRCPAGEWKRPAVRTVPRTGFEAIVKRILAKVSFVASTGCWEWQGAKSSGYGRVGYEGKTHGTHRLTYAAFVADIPDGLQIDHLCCNRGCVNPRHLEPVTARQNSSNRVVLRRAGLLPVIGQEPQPLKAEWHKELNIAALDRTLGLIKPILNQDPNDLRREIDLMSRLSDNHKERRRAKYEAEDALA